MNNIKDKSPGSRCRLCSGKQKVRSEGVRSEKHFEDNLLTEPKYIVKSLSNLL